VHVDFPLLQRLALPVAVGTAKYPGIKIHDTRMIRLMEVLLHAGTLVSGGRTRQIHDAILTTYKIDADRYGRNQLSYDLRKLKAHGLLARDGKRYAYRLTEKGAKVALLFVLFHKQLCGPLANSLFHHQPAAAPRPNSKLETAFHKADHSIHNIVGNRSVRPGDYELYVGGGKPCADSGVLLPFHIQGSSPVAP
jgi:hypothetical protein